MVEGSIQSVCAWSRRESGVRDVCSWRGREGGVAKRQAWPVKRPGFTPRAPLSLTCNRFCTKDTGVSCRFFENPLGRGLLTRLPPPPETRYRFLVSYRVFVLYIGYRYIKKNLFYV